MSALAISNSPKLKIKPKICGRRKELNADGIYEKFPQSLYKIRWK